MVKMIVHRDTDLVVGVHTCGADAAEMMQGVAVALRAGATKAVFDATVGIHPTSAEQLVDMRNKERTIVGTGFTQFKAPQIVRGAPLSAPAQAPQLQQGADDGKAPPRGPAPARHNAAAGRVSAVGAPKVPSKRPAGRAAGDENAAGPSNKAAPTRAR